MTQAADLAIAINTFVKGCKTDGTWDAIKACCIMAAWDGLTGALYPLKGGKPTNYNFVSGDYNRETGLAGDGSTKYLDSNRALNADPQNNCHVAVWASTIGNSNPLMAHSTWAVTGSTGVGLGGSRNRNATPNGITAVTGINAVNRTAVGSFNWRHGLSIGSTSATSETPPSDTYWLFRGDFGSPFYSSHRLSFYSIGESLDLALLDSRVSTLMTDIGAAIP
jgi:hypothetical protein